MEEWAADLVPWSRSAVVFTFVAVTVLSVVKSARWGRSARWAAAAFGAISLGLFAGWAPDALDVELPDWLVSGQLDLILLFPYLLMRFTASFEALPRWVERTAAAMTVVVMVTTVVLVTSDTQDRTGGLVSVYAVLVLAYWFGVSGVSILRLWRAGSGQATVPRRRMRLMSAAAAVLAVTLLTVALLSALPVPEFMVRLVTNLSALASGVAFALGFAPPRMARLAWRQPEERQLIAGTVDVLNANTPDAVARELLPPTASIIGAAGSALVDSDGRVWASHGNAPPVGARLGNHGERATSQLMEVFSMGADLGDLVVWTSPYSPFFGPDERQLLASLTAFAALALQRCKLLAAERAQQALLTESNDQLADALRQAEEAQSDAEHAREEATQANRAKTDFLARMSHELRTPLNAILGFGQLLETSELPPDAEEGVQYILKGGRHLLGLINEVLDLAGIEAGTLTLSLEPVHAGELINDTLAMIQPLASSRSIEVTSVIEPCNAYVVTDRQRCRQVLLNLLANAVKYNRDGGQVHIYCVPITHETLRVSVRDTGPGIDPARCAQLFEPFERLGAEGSGVEGTGLGLALSKQLMERLGGAIGVDTTPGEGSTFWIDLPVTDAPGKSLPTPMYIPTAAGDGTDWTLLLVEDNLANLQVVQGMLRRRPGVTVLPAMQGHIALDLAYEHQPDVILLDLHLPDMTGRDVLHRLRADPRTRDIPVVIASADASPRRAEQMRDAGAFEYLSKPLDLARFLDIMDTALAARRNRSANTEA